MWCDYKLLLKYIKVYLRNITEHSLEVLVCCVLKKLGRFSIHFKPFLDSLFV